MFEMARRHGIVLRTPDDISREAFRKKSSSFVNERTYTYSGDDWGERDEAA
jgi:hypothetical protein